MSGARELAAVVQRDGAATFWVERSARALGFDRLAESLLGEADYAPYLYVLTVLFLDVPVVNTINYYRGYDSLMTSPWWGWPGVIWWLIPAVVVLSVYFLRTLRDRYDRALDDVGRQATGPTVDPALSRGLQYSTLLLGLVVFAVWLTTAVGPILEEVGPLVGAFKWLVVVPLVYVPIGTDLTAAYVHVQLVLPRRVRAAGVALDFSDPRRLGGMYPLGRTMRFAAAATFVALTLYTVLWSLGLVVTPEMFSAATRTTVAVFFGLAWALAAGALVAGLFVTHRHMAASRSAELNRIHDALRQLGDDDQSIPYTAPRDEAEFRTYLREYVRLDRVERTRTVPVNVAVAWELVGVAVLPMALQVVTLSL